MGLENSMQGDKRRAEIPYVEPGLQEIVPTEPGMEIDRDTGRKRIPLTPDQIQGILDKLPPEDGEQKIPERKPTLH